MRLLAALIFCCAALAAAASEDIVVPSGKAVMFYEMIRDQSGDASAYRFRFISAEIAAAAGVDYEVVERDMAHLCETYALPKLDATGPDPTQIVISVSDRITEFGQAAPQAIQVFEAYSVAGQRCQWEPF